MQKLFFLSRQSAALAILALILLVGGSNTHAYAQSGSFCNLNTQELLKSLEGPWTIKHGRAQAYAYSKAMTVTVEGRAIGPAAGGTGLDMSAFPYSMIKAPPDATVNFTLDPSGYFIEATGTDGQMFLYAQMPGLHSLIADLFGAQAPAQASSNEVCAWSSAPLLTGSNYYVLHEGTSQINSLQSILNSLQYAEPVDCAAIEDHYDVTVIPGDELSGRSDWTIEGKWYKDVFCEKDQTVRAIKPGDMSMSMFIRFTGPNSGSGILHFVGDMGLNQGGGSDSVFIAQTPITLSR